MPSRRSHSGWMRSSRSVSASSASSTASSALQRLTREATVAQERRRLMADMHGSVGVSLISTLSLGECGGASSEQGVTA